MPLPLTRDGRREITAATILCAAGLVVGVWWFWPAVVLSLGLWLFVVAFFRDPERQVPSDPTGLVAPADGRLTEITSLEHDDVLGGPAIRIGIFLSIFDVHINRSPCDARVVACDYRKGRFVNAMRADSSSENEANTITLDATDPPMGRIVVRQIAGLIARRIICHCRPGDALGRGQRFGMIKFGSRTELVVPASSDLRIEAKVGDTVRGGRTILARLTSNEDHSSAS